MPDVTPIYQLPYPLPEEPVADGAQAIRALAETTESVLAGSALMTGAAVDVIPTRIEAGDGGTYQIGPPLVNPTPGPIMLMLSLGVSFDTVGTTFRWAVDVRGTPIGGGPEQFAASFGFDSNTGSSNLVATNGAVHWPTWVAAVTPYQVPGYTQLRTLLHVLNNDTWVNIYAHSLTVLGAAA